jgi:hypothetical protein
MACNAITCKLEITKKHGSSQPTWIKKKQREDLNGLVISFAIWISVAIN